MGGFLLRNPDNSLVALVDLGLGDNNMMGVRGGKMLDSLAMYGLQPGDVTDVLFTHLHLDHIGWASVGGELIFPNATYRCDQADWDYGVSDPSQGGTVRVNRYLRRQQELMTPAVQRLETWDRYRTNPARCGCTPGPGAHARQHHVGRVRRRPTSPLAR